MRLGSRRERLARRDRRAGLRCLPASAVAVGRVATAIRYFDFWNEP